MAEIFGVAAGAISVASIAIQIADSLRIAIDFWEAIQHSDEKISRISTQLHILYNYVAEIQREEQNGQIQGIQEELLRNTLIMMKRDLDNLTDLVSSLMLDISPSQNSVCRKIRRMQIALNDGKLSRAKDYVESATNLLHLLQSLQSRTMLRQMNSKIDAIIANATRVQKEPSHYSSIPSSLIPTSSIDPTIAGLLGLHTYDEYSSTSQQLLARFTRSSYINLFSFINGSFTATRTTYSNSFQLSSSSRGNDDVELYSSTKLTVKVLIGISSYVRGFRFQTNSLLNTCCLNSTRCIPNNSPIFRLCQSGDAQGMLKLFNTRTASIYDVDQNGQSLLHHACWSGKLDICRLLIDLGADIYQPDNRGFIPTSEIGSNPETGKTIHFMVEYGGVDPFQYYHLRNPIYVTATILRTIIPHDTLVYLLGSSCFYGDLHSRIIFIVDTIRTLYQPRANFFETIALLCTHYEALQSHRSNRYMNQSLLLHNCVYEWCWDKANNDEDTKDVESKIAQILKLTKDLHRTEYRARTALGCILCYASYNKSHTITLISNWLMLLSKNGISSYEYLQQEIQRHPDGYKVEQCCRSIKLTVRFEDTENGPHFDVENITRPIYEHLDPAYLCEAWRQRDPKLGSMSTCLSVVDQGLIYDGRPLPSAPGSWVTTMKPNSELELVNLKWTGWRYSPTWVEARRVDGRFRAEGRAI